MAQRTTQGGFIARNCKSFKAHDSAVRYFMSGIVFVLVFSLQVWLPYAQELPPEVEQMGYADTIFMNGKIVSMDDLSTSTNVGNVYQAIAVKGDKIMKLGTNQVKRLAIGEPSGHTPG